MEKIDEYLRRAKELRASAASARGSIKAEMETAAARWERLAQERLAWLQDRVNQGSLEWS